MVSLESPVAMIPPFFSRFGASPITDVDRRMMKQTLTLYPRSCSCMTRATRNAKSEQVRENSTVASALSTDVGLPISIAGIDRHTVG